jgi:UDP-N-acetylmuramyl pentapeptide phosphotransferase/UDP-N-acetylglucosamine-1-phosphate transferase
MTLMDSFFGVIDSPNWEAAKWGFTVTFLLCVAVVLTQRWHGKVTMDFTDGIQKFHTSPTPRIGGLPIVMGVLIALLKAPQEVQSILSPLLIASMLAFLFGLAEDMTSRVGVLPRLLATMASGILAWWLTDYSLSRVDVWGVDLLLQYTLVSVFFTAFAVGGVANAINIVDGFNGLASTTSALAFFSYAMLAFQVSDHALVAVAMILAACVWGFFWVNWPFGKIFLGDGGAYFIGFALAWLAVLLLERNPSVSAFAALVVCVHPVTEVLFSVYRRKMRKAHPGMPDRLHFHSLFKRRYIARWCSSLPVRTRNSITGLLIGCMTIVAGVLANITYNSVWLSAVALAVLVIGYLFLFVRMVRHQWPWPVKIS